MGSRRKPTLGDFVLQYRYGQNDNLETFA